MGIAKLYGQSGSGGKINGIIEDYYAYAGENISAGDFVEFINGIASRDIVGTSESVKLNTITYPSVIRTLLLSENRVFVAYGKSSVSGTGGTKSISAVICDVSGNTITPYTDTVIVNLTSGNSIGSLGIARLSNGSIMLAHDGTTNNRLYAVVCTINGATITAGADTQLSSQSNSGYNASCATLENNSAFIAHAEYNGYNVSGLVCTVSGTTITAGTDTKVTTTNNNDSNTITQTIYLGENKVCITFPHKIDSVSNTLCGMVCTVSGTAITAGTTTQLSSIQYSGWVHSTALLDKNKLFSVHGSNSSSSSSYLYGIVFSVSGTTITKGVDTQLSSIAYSCNGVALSMQSTKAFIAYNGNTDSIYLYGMVAEINNTTIIANTETLLGAGSYDRHRISTILVDGGNIFIANCHDNDNLLHVQMFSVDGKNNIPTNVITATEYETQVRKATTSDIYGVAKTSGTGAYKTVEYTVAEGESVSKGEERDFDVLETLISGDIIPKTWTDLSGSNINKEYVAEDGTKIFSWGGVPSNAFDGDTGSYWRGFATASKDNHIGIIFTEPKKITKLKTHIKEAYGTPCLIQGSKDGIEWVTLKSFGSTQTSLVEITLDNPDFYSQYKICFPNEVSALPEVYEVQVSEYIGFAPTKGIALQSGTSGDTIQIAVPITDAESKGHNDKVSIYRMPYSVSNFIKNGDFSNGLEGWDGENKYSTTEIINGVCVREVTSVLNGTGYVNYRFNAIIGHTYYMQAQVKIELTNVTLPQIRLLIVDSNAPVATATATEGWQTLSLIGTATRTSQSILGLMTPLTNIGDIFYFDNVKCYDLTEMFGAGNEPTKEWCDENL